MYYLVSISQAWHRPARTGTKTFYQRIAWFACLSAWKAIAAVKSTRYCCTTLPPLCSISP